jgi:hypothetical protein
LGGLLDCGHCGEEMVRLAATRHGRQYSYYGCAKAKKGGCAQAPVATEDLEEAVRQQVTPRFSLPYEGARGLREAVRRVRYHSGTRQVTIVIRDGSQWEFVLGRTARETERRWEPGRAAREVGHGAGDR